MTKKFLMILALLLVAIPAHAESDAEKLGAKIAQKSNLAATYERMLTALRDESCPAQANTRACNFEFNAARTAANRVLKILDTARRHLQAGNLREAESEEMRALVSFAELLEQVGKLAEYQKLGPESNNTPADGGSGVFSFLKT